MLRILFVCFALSLACRAPAASFLEKIEVMKSEGKLPGLAKDGVLLPRALLVDELRKSVDSDRVTVKDLVLSEEKGTVILVSRGNVSAEISIDFRFAEVDWPNRTIWMSYSESTRSASDTLLGRIFGAIAISVFEAASGSSHVESAFSGKPYFKLEKNRVGILLDRIPSLEGPLAWRMGRFRLFDLIGIRSIRTEKDRIHISLGLV